MDYQSSLKYLTILVSQKGSILSEPVALHKSSGAEAPEPKKNRQQEGQQSYFHTSLYNRCVRIMFSTMAIFDHLALIFFHGALRAGPCVRSSPLSALAEEMGTTFDAMMETATYPEDEESVGWEAGIDNVTGALLTVEHQLTKTRPFQRIIGNVA